MCYSAQIWTDHREFERELGAILPIPQYVKFFRERIERGTWRKIPKGLKDAFAHPRNDEERQLLELIAEGDADEARKLELDLFKLKTRLDYAERTLRGKPTEGARERASNDRRSIPAQMEAVQQRLADLRRSEAHERDSCVHPGQYAPVMIVQDGHRTAVPMRYQCRLPGWTAFVERQHPDSCHARREMLERTWSKLFGHRHGVMVATAFFAHVARHRSERRELAPGEQEEHLLVEFRPDPPGPALIPCLWNFSPRSTPEERDIFSFAIITDAAPPAIAAAGHDRCAISIKPENLDAWLNPDPDDLASLYAILDDRDRSYHAYREAA